MVPDDVPFATIVDNILLDTGFADQRAAKMDIDDLLKCVSVSPPFHRLFTEPGALTCPRPAVGS